MPILSSEEVHEIVSIVAHEENLKVTVNESMKGGVFVGACVMVGGLLLGPPGMAVGGIAGGIYAACTAKKFKPLHAVLGEMSSEERQLLQQRFIQATSNISYTDAAMLLTMMAGDGGLKLVVINLIKEFALSELKQKLA